MHVKGHVFAAAAALLLVATAADSQGPAAAMSPTYADLADLSLTAPIAAHVRLKRAVALKPAEAPNVAPGRTRFYVVADVVSLIRGAEGLPAQVSYLADVPQAGGKPPKLAKKSEYILLARTVPGRTGELQLVSPDAQLPFTAERAATMRSILRQAAAADAPPRITGIGRAFHVPGTIPGESETQIFLQTADGRPVSLSVLRRPGQAPRWAVALSEVTDDAAAPPAPNSLLWYRLACALPKTIPAQSHADAPDQAQAIRADYEVVIQGLGPCARTRAGG
jgi:hypothetical protein